MKSKRFRPQKILSFFWESATISSLSPALRPGHHSPVVFAEAMRRGQKCPLVLFRHARNGWPPQTRGMKSTSFSYGAGNNWHRWEEGESDHYVPPNDLTGDRIRGLHRTSCWAIYLRIIQATTMRVFACRIRNFKGGKKNVQAMKSLEDMRMFVRRTKVAQTMNWRIAKKIMKLPQKEIVSAISFRIGVDSQEGHANRRQPNPRHLTVSTPDSKAIKAPVCCNNTHCVELFACSDCLRGPSARVNKPGAEEAAPLGVENR